MDFLKFLMFHTRITKNFLDDLYFSMDPTFFIDYVDSLNHPPDPGETALMVPMFKWELLDNPNKLKSFFKHYDELVKRVLKINDEESMYIITGQHLGSFAILSDYDQTGEKTVMVTRKGPLKTDLLNSYDTPMNYGILMNLFSNFMQYNGRKLTKLLKGEYLSEKEKSTINIYGHL